MVLVEQEASKSCQKINTSPDFGQFVRRASTDAARVRTALRAPLLMRSYILLAIYSLMPLVTHSAGHRQPTCVGSCKANHRVPRAQPHMRARLQCRFTQCSRAAQASLSLRSGRGKYELPSIRPDPAKAFAHVVPSTDLGCLTAPIHQTSIARLALRAWAGPHLIHIELLQM